MATSIFPFTRLAPVTSVFCAKRHLGEAGLSTKSVLNVPSGFRQASASPAVIVAPGNCAGGRFGLAAGYIYLTLASQFGIASTILSPFNAAINASLPAVATPLVSLCFVTINLAI